MTKPRQTVITRVQALLERKDGASLAAICKVTGWQPHSARAALSGLRKAGPLIERSVAKNTPGGSIYRITGTEAGPTHEDR